MYVVEVVMIATYAYARVREAANGIRQRFTMRSLVRRLVCRGGSLHGRDRGLTVQRRFRDEDEHETDGGDARGQAAVGAAERAPDEEEEGQHETQDEVEGNRLAHRQGRI